ncbi:hypothetical protein SHIRM173S_06010 [Streptomyces hirsutus]
MTTLVVDPGPEPRILQAGAPVRRSRTPAVPVHLPLAADPDEGGRDVPVGDSGESLLQGGGVGTVIDRGVPGHRHGAGCRTDGLGGTAVPASGPRTRAANRAEVTAVRVRVRAVMGGLRLSRRWRFGRTPSW